MRNGQASIERRKHMRVVVRGAVSLRGRGREIHGRAVVVSNTSLEVRCQLGFALLSMAGAPVEIEMRFDLAGGSWFVAHGHVARVGAANHSLVIALDVLPEELSALLTAESANAASTVSRLLYTHSEREPC
jgi:hypothetical protein